MRQPVTVSGRPLRVFLVLVTLTFSVGAVPSYASSDVGPMALYGPEILFDVSRNGEHVGQHTVFFEQTADGLNVDAHMTIDIKFLGFKAYSYDYRSTSLWRDGRLVRLDSQIDDDGDISRVEVRSEGDRLVVTAADGARAETAPIYPTDHWNAGVLGASKVINTITGRIDQVEIEPLGESDVDFNGASTAARHYQYTGDLSTEVWYDRDGRWVKMRFKAQDGSTIEYTCRNCAAEHAAAALQ